MSIIKARQIAVAASGFRMNLEVNVFSAVVGFLVLQRRFDGFLMMGIVMPETCSAVSVRQSNKILRLTVASSWVFYLSDRRCAEPQTLNTFFNLFKKPTIRLYFKPLLPITKLLMMGMRMPKTC
jgi:hypothetical protein